MTGEEIAEDSLTLCNEAATIICEAGMHLMKWTTKRSELKVLPGQERLRHADLKYEPPSIK